jgi:hypothetical protein
MKRLEIKRHNQAIIALVKTLQKNRHANRYSFYRLGLRLPRMGCKELAAKLNAGNMQTSRGNSWTFRSLYRMIQRQGVRLHDI